MERLTCWWWHLQESGWGCCLSTDWWCQMRASQCAPASVLPHHLCYRSLLKDRNADKISFILQVNSPCHTAQPATDVPVSVPPLVVSFPSNKQLLAESLRILKCVYGLRHSHQKERKVAQASICACTLISYQQCNHWLSILHTDCSIAWFSYVRHIIHTSMHTKLSIYDFMSRPAKLRDCFPHIR